MLSDFVIKSQVDEALWSFLLKILLTCVVGLYMYQNARLNSEVIENDMQWIVLYEMSVWEWIEWVILWFEWLEWLDNCFDQAYSH